MVSPDVRQIWTMSGVFLNFVSHGLVLSYSSCLLPGLRADDSPIKVDLNSASWLASGMGIVMSFSFYFTTISMQRFGRRLVHASTVILVGVGWLLIYWAEDFTTLLFGRLVGGSGISGGLAAGCCVISEFVAPKYRGIFLNLKTVLLFSAYLLMHVLGHFLSWRTVALLCILPCVLSIANNLTWPESPSWLLSKNRFEECEESFYWLRGRSETAVKELQSMVRAQKLRMHTPVTNSLSQKFVNVLKTFKQKNFIRPLTLIFFGSILIETTGRHYFSAYAVDVIVNITKNESHTFWYIIGVDTVALLSTIISCILLKVVGLKPLLFFSAITSTILLFSISLISFLISRGCESIDNLWLVPSLAGIFFICANLGCTSIPIVLYGEIFPLQHRELGLGFGGALQTIILFLYLKFIPYSFQYLKLHGTFAWSSALMVVTMIYLYFNLPETKNRTLQEIEDYFEHGEYLDADDNSLDVDVREKMLSARAQCN